MAIYLLTDRRIQTAKPREKAYRLHDGNGLALLVLPSGVKSWQYRFRWFGKEQTVTLGRLLGSRGAQKFANLEAIGLVERLKVLSLEEARTICETYRALCGRGEHPVEAQARRRMQVAVDEAATFEKFSASWIAREAKRAAWSADYREEVEASLKNHLSGLDRLPMTKITAAIAAPILAAAEERAPHMLEKVRRRLRAILDDAVEQGLIPGNPLPAPRRRARTAEPRHYPAVTALEPLGAILRAARASDPCKGIARAHALLAFTSQRVGEIVPAAWTEFDLESATWSIPRTRMKRKDPQRGPHLVPLPPGLLAMLWDWREVDGTSSVYVCPAPRDPKRHITPEAVEKHYRDVLGLAGKHSPHSWRSAFSTICRDAGKEGDVIEGQLDHVVGTKVSSAYDRAHRLELRRELMKWYEEQLTAARDGAIVLPMKPRKSQRS